jgi:hypothetical protein
MLAGTVPGPDAKKLDEEDPDAFNVSLPAPAIR